MSVIVSLLRGVNVGGHHKIKMDALREIYDSLGLRGAQTCLQSGNVVFSSAERDVVRLASRIENGIERSFGFRPAVILRTLAELKSVIEKNPFATRRDIHPSRLLVTFLASDPGAEARDKILQINGYPEELRIDGRELFIYFPNGMARPKLPAALVERTLQTPGTGRNWNTVMKLLEIAEKLEAGRGH